MRGGHILWRRRWDWCWSAQPKERHDISEPRLPLAALGEFCIVLLFRFLVCLSNFTILHSSARKCFSSGYNMEVAMHFKSRLLLFPFRSQQATDSDCVREVTSVQFNCRPKDAHLQSELRAREIGPKYKATALSLTCQALQHLSRACRKIWSHCSARPRRGFWKIVFAFQARAVWFISADANRGNAGA